MTYRKRYLLFTSAVIGSLAAGLIFFWLHGNKATLRNANNSENEATGECAIHLVRGQQESVIYLDEALVIPDWPIFSTEAYAFAYPSDWEVSSVFSSGTDEHRIFPKFNPKTESGTAIVVNRATTTTSKIRDSIRSHTSYPIEEISCTLAGMPASVLNVGDKNYSDTLTVAIFGSYSVSSFTLIEPAYVDPYSLNAFRGVLNSFREVPPAEPGRRH